MSETPEFRLDVHQNEYLPEDGKEVHAIVSVHAEAGGGLSSQNPPPAEVVMILDSSGSMASPRDKIQKAKAATAVAIDELREGVGFAVVAGDQRPRMVWPPEPRLVPADSRSRAEAKEALHGLRAGGGTAMGQWLLQAHRLFGDHPGAIRHAILLTDGKNQHETADQLADALGACDGRFTCDCRGVGDDWDDRELGTIASRLLGTLGLVAQPSGLAEDFREMMSRAMDKALGDVRLRLWTPEGATIRFVKQVVPTIEDLTEHRQDSAPLTGDYPTGSWGTESRDYHICIDVLPRQVRDKMLAGRVTFVIQQPDGTEKMAGQGLIRVEWTTDADASAQIDSHVAHYTDQEELSKLIRDGLDAKRSNDIQRASDRLGQALKLAKAAHNEQKVDQLQKFVEYDPATDTVQLRESTALDDLELGVTSTESTPLNLQEGD